MVFVIQSDDNHIKVFDSDTITVLASLPRFSAADKESIRNRALEALKIKDDPVGFFHKDG